MRLTHCAVLRCAVAWRVCVCCSTVFEDVYQAVVYGIEEQLTGDEGSRKGFASAWQHMRVVVGH